MPAAFQSVIKKIEKKTRHLRIRNHRVVFCRRKTYSVFCPDAAAFGLSPFCAKDQVNKGIGTKA